jgi:hypothetical protein
MLFLASLGIMAAIGTVQASPENVQHWAREFPKTDFTKRTINFSEIRADGATRDSIEPIHKPKFVPVAEVTGLGELEPVISLSVNFEARAYPLRVLLWHEIVNDVIDNMPIAVTYCPLCNSSVVFKRSINGKTAVFGNTGRLRHFDMVMYDLESESWWQQFTGRAIIGARAGEKLEALPSRVESLARFRERHPDGQVLAPSDPAARPYGTTPFVRMDTSSGEGLGDYNLPVEVKPFDRVVVVGGEAWTFKRLREKGDIERDDLYIGIEPGQNSIHDTKWINFGRDVGNVVVRRFDAELNDWVDAVHDVSFAFAFKAFVPGGVLYSW